MKYYNLSPVRDMDLPFAALPTQTIDGHQGISMARFKVVAEVAGFKTLWKLTLLKGVVKSAPFMQQLHDRIDHFTAMREEHGGKIKTADFQQAKELLDGLRSNQIGHSAQSQERHPGFDTFWQIFCWLPGNLFEGPAMRADDQRGNFEDGAAPIVGQARYDLLKAINSSIAFENIDPAWASLRQILDSTDPVAFKAEQWEWDQAADSPRIKAGG
ncbi:hypothetical protein RM844_28410 [Streptomyces sp. DSM 44915]|uniref:Uncharacterized protein n=1 Tax=Streptomyces chisholmiae TaxID=3075540 RepID=A0ABU2JZ18_9ACTN|nr:hypothetical protein [Streptomyces sp. DSM 44915]MDT0270200.1 hypothetical protein [Streptomyces sp. DSM 44915]